jgi:hypothetical protein
MLVSQRSSRKEIVRFREERATLEIQMSELKNLRQNETAAVFHAIKSKSPGEIPRALGPSLSAF